MSRIVETEGYRFGRLLATEEVSPVFSGVQFKRKRRYLCQCDCGNKIVVQLGNLRSGHTQSCGCLQIEKTSKANTTHGHCKGRTRPDTYSAWAEMSSRCTNPKVEGYPHYGGRGIKVCERWHDYENFLSDMGERPEGMTIERIRVNGDYEPRNCIWANAETQANNTRRNVLIWTGENYTTLARFAKAYGIPYHRFYHQYKTKGIPIEQILLEGNYLD